ncbi:LOW QUALITY PROTEIN: hypothetical protein U9M48_004295 [Paspalum notatum var. saurae]|uniref:NB-ARC domain-containing protein n=1 Tax=Paspalum notatum var. saurae TaxID=547442 RepID=A0AAQ3PMC8_PASNO
MTNIRRNIISLNGTKFANLKEQGGLGILDLEVQNKCLLSKWLFKLANEDGIWQSLLRNKYLKAKPLGDEGKKPGVSHFWAGLMDVKQEFLSLGSFAIGDGTQVRFWEDTWCGNQPLKLQYPSLFNIVRKKGATVADVMSSVPLNISFRRGLYGERLNYWNELVGRVMNLALRVGRDKFIWGLNKTGVFTVRSMYKHLINNGIIVSQEIWKTKILLKTKIFMWYVKRGVLLTKDNLAKRNWNEASDLQRTLASEINQKRVLLVLDDVWNERRDCWELFHTPLKFSKICQIIITTRSESVARLIQTMPFYHLDCLSFDESCKVACIGEQESGNPTNLTEIGKSIVERCKGLPLAIKTLGSMLRYETDESSWKDSELWDFEQPRNEVLPALELSYKHMPVYLRRCLLSLSLYPKDYRLHEDRVLQFWKMLDLFHCDGSEDECAIGRLYLKELVQRSMLQTDGDSYYGLHDLIYDLACFLAGEEFYRLEGDH